MPVFAASDGSAAAVEESATATVAVLPAGADWRTATDFGQPAAGLAEHLACPTLVIHAAPSATPITTPTTAKCEDLAAV